MHRSKKAPSERAAGVSVQFFGSRPTQIRLELEQAIRQNWRHVKFDQHRMLLCEKLVGLHPVRHETADFAEGAKRVDRGQPALRNQRSNLTERAGPT
jgi:hypothetical protein